MNIEQLRYALEIGRTKSINKAAENLYLSQPNLSRSIKALENEIGFKIFSRQSHGVEITIQGNDFLAHASAIVEELDKINNIAHPGKEEQKFSISVPKGAYITKAFSNFISLLDKNKRLSIDFKECGSIGAIENIKLHNFNLGIIRYYEEYENMFHIFLKEEGLTGREICTFRYLLAFSKNNALAAKESLKAEDFDDMIQLIHGDSYLPYINSENEEGKRNKVIRIYDSMGQLTMLKEIPNTFMAVLPLDEETLEKYGLVQREVEGYSKTCKDVLIFKKNYVSSNLDKMFVDELEKQARH